MVCAGRVSCQSGGDTTDERFKIRSHAHGCFVVTGGSGACVLSLSLTESLESFGPPPRALDTLLAVPVGFPGKLSKKIPRNFPMVFHDLSTKFPDTFSHEVSRERDREVSQELFREVTRKLSKEVLRPTAARSPHGPPSRQRKSTQGAGKCKERPSRRHLNAPQKQVTGGSLFQETN